VLQQQIKHALAGVRSGTSATLALVGVIPAVHLQRMRSIVNAGCT
jgi:hypothetical protein